MGTQAAKKHPLPPAPDAAGEMPDTGFRPDQWLAYQLLDGGLSRRKTAERVGCSVSALGGWLKTWRKRYGEDLFATQAAKNLADYRDGTAFRTQQVAGDKAGVKLWTEMRSISAGHAGEAGDRARALMIKVLDEILEDEERRQNMTARDVAQLARAAEHMYRAADQLAGVASADQQARGAILGAKKAEEDSRDVDLSALGAPTDQDEADMGKLVEISGFLKKFDKLQADGKLEEDS